MKSPGCGMTRACIALFQGQLDSAWRYHPFAFVLIPLALAMACFPAALQHTWSKRTPTARNRIAIAGIVMCLCLWVHRLLSTQ